MKMIVSLVCGLALLQVGLADHSMTPSVSNVPSTTNTKTPSSTAVPSGGLIRDAHLEQESPFFKCSGDTVADTTDPDLLPQTWSASFFYMINQDFFIEQCIRWFSTEAKCNSGNPDSAYLEICFNGAGGPFGASLTDSLYTLQRFEFSNASVTGTWRGWRRMNGVAVQSTGWDDTDTTAWCDCSSDWPMNDMEQEDYTSCIANGCPVMEPWLTYPHYNTYKTISDTVVSMTIMVEDILTEFDSLELINMVPSPDTASITPTVSATPSIEASGTPSNSPLGPFLTEWQQSVPRLNCDEDPPVRTDFDFAFGSNDGSGLGNFHYYGNVTGYPSTTTCQLGFREIFTAAIAGLGTAYIESAKKEGQSDSRTLLTVHPAMVEYTAHKWRGTKKWNEDCQCDNDDDSTTTIQTGGSSTIAYNDAGGYFREPLHEHGITECCPLLAKYLGKSHLTIKQHDDKNDYEHHRVADISDFFSDWFSIDHDGTKASYFPTDRERFYTDTEGTPSFLIWRESTSFLANPTGAPAPASS